MKAKTLLDNAPTLYIQTGKEQSALFAMNFARDVRHFVLRITGGCGLMSPEDALGLANLENALKGGSREESPLPRFSGFGLFGGTRMLSKSDPSQVVPGVTEVLPAITGNCPGAVFLGVIAKVGQLKYTSLGVVIHDEPDAQYFTIIHPTQHSIVLLQPTPDARASWEDEFRECIRFCHELRMLDWQSLLLVYNGGGVVEKEILAWAKLGRLDPDKWKVLLVNGSGRKADEYANNKKFLSHHPTVHVCQNTEQSIREKLTELGALI